MLTRKNWLLIGLCDRLEPIQVQKTLFKFAKEASAPTRQRYSFTPYNWGPCSFAIYDDLSALREEKLVEFELTGLGWNRYKLTKRGRGVVKDLRKEANPNLLERMDDIREWVTSRSFDKLLEDVYEDYPDSAKRSLFKK